MFNLSDYPALTVMAIAVAAALLAEIRIGLLRVPAVVWQMVFGMLLGPHIFALAKPGPLLEWFGHSAGLGALFFMAGMELDLEKVKGRPLSLALRGWVFSLAMAFAVSALLYWRGLVLSPVLVALVLTTTAMGTFMPMLRDAGHFDSKFGNLVLAAGAVGEFCPIIVVSLLLTHVYGAWQQIALMLGFVALAVGAALIAVGFRQPTVLALLERHMHSSTQLPILISVLLLAAFDVLSKKIGLETVIGAFAAGMIVGLASRGERGKLFREKMQAICFGLLVPCFFVISGMDLDADALVRSTRSMLLVPIFLGLFLLVRGAPVWLYRKDLVPDERWPFALYSATALSMVVAITDIGVRTGRMRSEIAAALVGAGLLSVLLFPTIAGAMLAKRAPSALRAKA